MTGALLRAVRALRASLEALLGLRSGTRRRHGDVLVDGRWVSREVWERSELRARRLRRW